MFLRDGSFHFLLKLNGNTPAEQGQPLFIRGEILSPHRMPIMQLAGSRKLLMLAPTRPMLGAFTICMEMFPSGVWIGTVNFQIHPQQILSEKFLAKIKEIEVGILLMIGLMLAFVVVILENLQIVVKEAVSVSHSSRWTEIKKSFNRYAVSASYDLSFYGTGALRPLVTN